MKTPKYQAVKARPTRTTLHLMDYQTGECIRIATEQEIAESDEKLKVCPSGVIVVDGRSCYVD